MKRKLYLSILIIMLILGITNKCLANVKSFEDVASDYGMTAEELNMAIEQGLEPEDFKFKDSSETPTMAKSVTSTIVRVIIILIIGVLIYLIPTIVAVKKSHPNKLAIVLIDVFLGWSLLGWVGALVWACITPSEKKINGNKYENLANLQKLKEQGIISKEEFENEKSKLLK